MQAHIRKELGIITNSIRGKQMVEEVSSMLKCKVWRFVEKKYDLMNKDGIKHRLSLEPKEEGLGNENTIVGMDIRRISLSRRLL